MTVSEGDFTEIVLRLISARRAEIEMLEAWLSRSRTVEHETGNGRDPVEDLRARCAAEGIPVSGDDHVSEAHAGRLLRVSKWTLRNRRQQDRPLACRKRFGRWEYSLEALAASLVARENREE